MNPGDSVRQQNPLGKIPALVLEDGTVLFDSRVILEYLDHRAGGGRIIPTASRARVSPRCACRRSPTASSMRRSCWSTRDAGGRPSSTNRNGSISRPARSRARSAALEAAPPALDCDARCRPDRARVCARLSRPSLPRHLARGSSALGRVARRVRPPRAGLCRDQAAGVSERGQMQRADWQQKSPGSESGA